MSCRHIGKGNATGAPVPPSHGPWRSTFLLTNDLIKITYSIVLIHYLCSKNEIIEYITAVVWITMKILKVPRQVAVQKKARMKMNRMQAPFRVRQVQKRRRTIASLNRRGSNRQKTTKEEQEAKS